LGGCDGSWRFLNADKIYSTWGLQNAKANLGVQGQAREDISGEKGQGGKWAIVTPSAVLPNQWQESLNAFAGEG
jgi:hypothetical protein